MKLNPNTNDSIRFNLNMTKKELNISIDSNLKASLQDSVDADNEYESCNLTTVTHLRIQF